ncbi:hypothetical protein F4805DRAFT_474359 [Annulohypoxylon moriforme]|nr:hypothetical protein F4805DRAFT_474359 [Annulohypoxylon moriforme]
MDRESKGKDKSHSEKREDGNESRAARIARKLAEGRQLAGRVKDKLPSIDTSKSIKGDIKTIINDTTKRGRSRLSQLSSGSSSRTSSISGIGELFKKRVNITKVKQDAKPKQKDPLHQWMVENSGGVLRERG